MSQQALPDQRGHFGPYGGRFVADTLYNLRKKQASLPIMVGFGIKIPEMAANVAEFADGVIVGAALISQIQAAFLEKTDAVKAGATLINNMRSAMDNKGSEHD